MRLALLVFYDWVVWVILTKLPPVGLAADTLTVASELIRCESQRDYDGL